MTPERYYELEVEGDSQLTPEEMEKGWHFCPDWDYMLVGPGMDEAKCCTCEVKYESL